MRATRWFPPCLVLLLAAHGGCHTPAVPTPIAPGLHSPYIGYASPTYSRDAMWLCRPGLPGDVCHSDLTATEVVKDASRTAVNHQPASAPRVDCFYVYPTVDLRLMPANHTDFQDLTEIKRTTLAQVARYSEACAVYAPLYRQVTIGTYFTSNERRESFQAAAFSDVLDAFLHYMGTYNHGRKVVLIGHSQGADMIARLLRRIFDQDPVMRERLLLALAIGGPVEVPRGQLRGGSFENIPLCSRPDEQGCVVAYRSFRAGAEITKPIFPPKAGNEPACVNPAELGTSETRPLSRTYYPADAQAKKLLRGLDDVNTPFVLYRGYYAAACATSPMGYRYLAISVPPAENRQPPIDLTTRAWSGGFGTHVLDMQFAQGDLIDLVAKRAASLAP